MITKPERIIKRLIKAVAQRQSVLVIGEWQEELIKGIRENKNSISQLTAHSSQLTALNLEANSFTRIVADYSYSLSHAPNLDFFSETRRLLLPTGMVIITANCEENIIEKIFNLFNKNKSKDNNLKKIKPKVLQDQVHDNGFLIEGYYGYPGGHLLMMAQIKNKEVTTLFAYRKQETIRI